MKVYPPSSPIEIFIAHDFKHYVSTRPSPGTCASAKLTLSFPPAAAQIARTPFSSRKVKQSCILSGLCINEKISGARMQMNSILRDGRVGSEAGNFCLLMVVPGFVLVVSILSFLGMFIWDVFADFSV